MTREILSTILRQKAKAIHDRVEQADPAMGEIYCEQCDIAELLKVLARFVDGKSLYDAFGAPGGWGYDNMIGATLAELYRSDATVMKGVQQP